MTRHFPLPARAAVLAALLAGTYASTVSAQPATDAALATITALARINGQALACRDDAAARRAKALMLAHAPKTARFGEAFEGGTQQGFVATTQGQPPCAEPQARAQALDALERELQAQLPATAAAR